MTHYILQKHCISSRMRLLMHLRKVFFLTQIDFKQKRKTDEDTDEDIDEEMDTTDMPELESEESAAERRNQRGEVKILTPNQMLSRLPIALAQLKAGNNSEKLKNEIS